jgi:lipid-A-disaccharide synthase
VLLPEYLTRTDKSDAIAAHAIEWLTDAAARADRVAALCELRDRYAQGGASARGAEYIAAALQKSRAAAA